MSNATLKKRRQKKSIKTSSSKLKYKVEPVKVKDDFKWNGVLQVGVDEIIFKNGKKDLSRILPEKERFLKQKELN